MLGFARVCYKVKLAAAMPSSDEIKRLTRSMFEIADKDHGGDISASEFVSWARMHIFGRRLIGVCVETTLAHPKAHICVSLWHCHHLATAALWLQVLFRKPRQECCEVQFVSRTLQRMSGLTL